MDKNVCALCLIKTKYVFYFQISFRYFTNTLRERMPLQTRQLTTTQNRLHSCVHSNNNKNVTLRIATLSIRCRYAERFIFCVMLSLSVMYVVTVSTMV